jgi:Mrp family chromosome partitioning ATPase/uncharacterized protein involved in exopolysaccharide biosynthesis
MDDSGSIKGVISSRPFTLLEAFSQVLRRWYIVLLVGAAGAAGTYVLKDRFRPAYESEASFRILRAVQAPVVDSQVHIPVEDPPEPAVLATSLRDEALANQSLDALFAAHPKVFAHELARGREAYVKFLRKHAKLEPKTEKLYGVVARGKSPEQARAFVAWIISQAMTSYRRMQTERAKTLSKFTGTQADKAKQKLTAHEDKMIAHLRQHPDLLVGALDRDRRLNTAGPDRMRVQSVLRRAGSSLSDKDPALRALMEQRNRLRAELRSLEDADDTSPSSGAARLKELNQAKARLNALKVQGLGEDHPTVKQAKREIARLDAAAMAARPGQATRTSAYSARVRAKLKEIDKKLGKKLKRSTTSPRLEAKWGEMVREQRLLLGNYDSLNRLASSAAYSNRLGDAEAKLLAKPVETATTPKQPIGVKPKMILAAGCALSLLLGLGLALVIGGFDRKIYGDHEVTPLLGLPLLAVLERQSKGQLKRGAAKPDQAEERLMAWSKTEEQVEVGVRLPADGGEARPTPVGDFDSLIDDGGVLALPPARGEAAGGAEGGPLVKAASMNIGNILEEDRAVTLRIRTVVTTAPAAAGLFLTTAPRSAGADQMRLLASRLQDQAEPCQVVVVTSWEPGVGRTTLAANLALAMAESRRRTLLIDTCGGDAALTRMFGLRPEEETSLYAQLSARMAGTTDTWSLYKVAEALSVIPAGTEPRPMAPMLSSLAFAELVDQLKSIFDVLIFDSVALDRGSDAVVLQQQADTVLAVVRRKRSKLTGFAELARQIDPPRLSGVIFNRA